MNRLLPAPVLACASLLALRASPAGAHVVVGDRVFPVTLTFDDPGVGDEFTLPQITWQRSAGPDDLTQYQWESDKTITPNTAIIYNHGYDVLNQAGMKTRTGFENVVLTGKWEACIQSRARVRRLGRGGLRICRRLRDPKYRRRRLRLGHPAALFRQGAG